MRLPFLQLESDIIGHGAAEVSHLSGCSIPEALGHIALIRAWAVSLATDEAPPDGHVSGDSAGRRIEAAAHWRGEKGVLLQALIDAGQVRHGLDGLYVLRLEPYVEAWNKNRTAKERMRTLRERSANKRERTEQEGDTDDERSAKFGGQTQTQTQREETASQAPAVAATLTADLPDATDEAEELPARPTLELVAPVAGKAPRKAPPGEVLYAKLEDRRGKACAEAGVPFIPSRWAFSRMNRELAPIARLEAENPAAYERFRGAWLEFITDPAARDADEPFPLAWFLKNRGRYEGRALKAGGES